MPAQPGISAVRHQPSAALPSARCVSSAVGVATFDLSSSTHTRHWMVHRVQPAVSDESLRRLSAVSLRTSGSTPVVGPPGPPGPTRTGLSRNHSHMTGGVVANVVVPTADYVRCGAITVFGRLVRGGWVSVRLGPGEEHQTELTHLHLVAVG
jgi:hypothetical protein